MPTENRSSNTEIAAVLAPFAAVADCYDDAEEDSFQPAHDIGLHKDLALTLGLFRAVRTLLARPAPQPHPEPIAWMVGTAIWWTREEAERDAAATGLPIVGLGPMTGAAEAERLRVELGYMREERDDLSAKLDRFYSRSHGIKNLSAIEKLSDQVSKLERRKEFDLLIPVGCACVNVGIGSYENQVEIPTPPHMLAVGSVGCTQIRETTCVDKCIAPLVEMLWSMGVVTTGSCCGHNQRDGYIGILNSNRPDPNAD